MTEAPLTRTADDGARPLRRDAVRNRALILQTAAEVFAERGLEAGYDEIARRAGVGVGTVYRRFPERSELISALFESRIDEIVENAHAAVRMPSGWDGLVWFLTRTLERQVADRGLKEVMASTITEDDHRALGRDRLAPLVDDLFTRAKADGDLRPDVEPTDLGVQLMLLSSVSTPEHPELWRRYLALCLDGLRARPGLVPLSSVAPEDDVMHELIENLHRR